jgi:hypothetical protein
MPKEKKNSKYFSKFLLFKVSSSQKNSFFEEIVFKISWGRSEGGVVMEHEGPLGLYQPKDEKCSKLLRLQKFQFLESQS